MTSQAASTSRALLAQASRRWIRMLPWAVAFVLCVALLPTTIQVLNVSYGLNGSVATALAVAQTAPLLLAVVHPMRAWYVIFAADIVGALLLLTVDAADPIVWPFPAMEIIGYIGLCLAVGLRESRRTLLQVWLSTAIVSIFLRFVAPPGSTDTTAVFIVLSGVALVLGGALRERYEAQRRLAEQETISEVERARRTLLEERARIARELHDVVAHHMSVITVQADTAAYRLAHLPPDAVEEFSSIASTARQSLSEMRRILGVLRNEESHGELAPQPGLEQVEQLVEQAVRAGVPAELVLGDVDVPEAVGLSAYRIVQEALANVVRHAPGAATEVSARVIPDDDDEDLLTVRVVNGPPRAVKEALEHGDTGHGLVGMRERVRLVGGRLDVGPTPDGGFRVIAHLPLTEKELP